MAKTKDIDGVTYWQDHNDNWVNEGTSPTTVEVNNEPVVEVPSTPEPSEEVAPVDTPQE
jgi:hypothetical protein